MNSHWPKIAFVKYFTFKFLIRINIYIINYYDNIKLTKFEFYIFLGNFPELKVDKNPLLVMKD